MRTKRVARRGGSPFPLSLHLKDGTGQEMLGQEAGPSESKRRKSDRGEDNVDWISALPDAILTHLLSFLRTKEAVRTSVLSKRWKYAWTSVTTLEFNEALDMVFEWSEEKNAWYFRRFVDEALSLHNCLFIKKYTLKCDPCQLSHIYKWVSAATIRHVEELFIIIQASQSSQTQLGSLPSCLYTCERLRVLKIEGCFVLRVPALVCLNSLQVLRLEGIKIRDGNSLTKLFKNTPLLDELHLSSFSWSGVETLYICSPTLKKLFIRDDSRRAISESRCIVVDSPSLTSLDIFCDVLKLKTSPSLVSVNIGHHSSLYTDNGELLESISNVVRLQIWGLRKTLFKNDGSEIPIFPNLKHLEIEVVEGTWQYVSCLLRRCPNLASLGLTFLAEENYADPLLDCLPSRLEEIMIRDFQGSDFEVQAPKYLLKKGNVLKKMTVFLADWVSEMCRAGESSPELAILKVVTFPKCSTNCEITFP